MGMYCNQCQEASKNIACTIAGVCGKKEDVANLQDALLGLTRILGKYHSRQFEENKENKEISSFILKSLFRTITNANFDEDDFVKEFKKGLEFYKELSSDLKEKNKPISELEKVLNELISTKNESLEKEHIISFGLKASFVNEKNEDIKSLKELVLYGLKGLAAYVEHAEVLGYIDKKINKFLEATMGKLLLDDLSVDDWVSLVLQTGEYGVQGMGLLNKANTEKFGNPEPTEVSLEVKPGPGILVSGHDLLDLIELLEQTKDKGINIYTHGEMLPAHAYPKLKEFPHLVGNYGSSWWNQTKDFDSFNGPILLTTNCLVPPKKSYIDRVFTTGVVSYPGTVHIPDRESGKQKDFSALIEKAKQCDSPKQIEQGTVWTGFAEHTLLSSADAIVNAVKDGAISRFVVMAGCDGRFKNRQYYTDVAEKLPSDTIILTAGCAKYRYNKLDLGKIGDFPRVLDAGQCNDSYSLAIIALKLKEVLGLDDINKLPLSFDIAWYEQKAVIVLLALLYLGVKHIRLGPTLPAFLSPNVTKVLVDNFDIKPIKSADEDVSAIIKGE